MHYIDSRSSLRGETDAYFLEAHSNLSWVVSCSLDEYSTEYRAGYEYINMSVMLLIRVSASYPTFIASQADIW